MGDGVLMCGGGGGSRAVIEDSNIRKVRNSVVNRRVPCDFHGGDSGPGWGGGNDLGSSRHREILVLSFLCY